jgi:uncharacterized membrane protein YgcG
MKCPRCYYRIHRGAELCPHCEFSIKIADEKFVAQETSVKLLNDSVGLLKRLERLKIEQAITKFSKKFPQIFFSIYTGAFQKKDDIEQFGIWYLNRVSFKELDKSITNKSGILLVIDSENHIASISYGYFLDALLSEKETFLCLSKAYPALLEHRITDGILIVIEQCKKFFQKKVSR